MTGKGISVMLLLAVAVTQFATEHSTAAPHQFESTALGWASVDGGTQGGQGGSTVTVTDAKSLVKFVQSIDPLISHVSGDIRLNDMIKVQSDKTIAGFGANAVIIGGGLQLRKVETERLPSLIQSGAGVGKIGLNP